MVKRKIFQRILLLLGNCQKEKETVLYSLRNARQNGKYFAQLFGFGFRPIRL